jgi:hypothetical protein
LSYRLETWRYGFIGNNAESNPRRAIQALLRHRAADSWAIERWLILCDIRADLAAYDEERGQRRANCWGEEN